jgi:SAM-dependent methyltransferase
MNRNKLKAYAPKARRDFIRAVTDRAAVYGLTKKGIEPVVVQGDVGLIGGKPFPKDVVAKRKRLVERIERDGFEQVMEAVAYTWFNRFAAIRFMEVHGYLDHGYKVLGTTNHTPVEHPKGDPGSTGRANGTNERNLGLPEILGYAEHVELVGVDRERVVELKLAGNRDEELYRMLLVGQCNALHKAMPFLFGRIGDATELLLPENLLHSDSLIRRMVNEVPEEEWQEVEILGWLYQFYISEKKDQVIGKVVKSEDIPAATQLFTPNWIVKYMVQNTIGRMWLATYPDSPLKKQMEYYIEPAEQTTEVIEQLKAITPKSLYPEEMTLADVACGSGHILVEGYDLFKAIYQERGYRAKDIPRLILEKNLYGLDIDDRAAQLAAFALMMKAREDDRRIFERGVKLNVLALVDSAGFDAEGLAERVELADGLRPGDLTELKGLFEHATTFGSLIQVPDGLAKKLPELKQLSEATSQDLFVSDALKRLGPLVRQAELLAAKYDAVVANPPYMGNSGMNTLVKEFAKQHFPDAKTDLFACFIERSYTLAHDAGCNSMVTMQSWMFLSSFEMMREQMLSSKTIGTMAQIGYNSFPSMNSKIALATVFTFMNRRVDDYISTFTDLNSAHPSADKKKVFLERNPSRHFEVSADEFKKIPGTPLAYWVSDVERDLYVDGNTVDSVGEPRKGIDTGENGVFLRMWWEVSEGRCSFLRASEIAKWFPYSKGGDFRRWFGNRDHVVNWRADGADIKARLQWAKKKPTIRNTRYFFREGFSWTTVTWKFSARYTPSGAMFDNGGCTLFCDDPNRLHILGALLNSKVAQRYLGYLSPTLNFQPGDIGKILYRPACASEIAKSLVGMSCNDWNAYERSWDFQSVPILTAPSDPMPTLESSYTAWVARNCGTIAEMKRLEEENNRVFIDAYGLADELTPDVPIDQITLTVNPAYRYGSDLTEEEQWTRFRHDTMKELVSYAVGCMMGRYSLDAPGLIYAHSGNDQFWEIYHEKHNQPVPTQVRSGSSADSPAPLNRDDFRGVQLGWLTFPPDADGIIPITDTDWFPDDASNRFFHFLSVAWPKEHLEENLQFIADSLSPNRGESPRETIRRYMATGFFKHHLKMYKKRPIYWLFSSGKLRAFQCLVYLHRYNEGTLSRMRTEYVIPLQGKISARIEQLAGDILAATSTAHRKKLERERGSLIKQQAELQTFDEKLRHYADMRISLDLDDGVKVNYGKFGELLAEVNAITGKK